MIHLLSTVEIIAVVRGLRRLLVRHKVISLIFYVCFYQFYLSHALVEIGEYCGCYKDYEQRALPYARFKSYSNMTNEICQFHCLARGYAFAGTQYFWNCYCGDKLPPLGDRF